MTDNRFVKHFLYSPKKDRENVDSLKNNIKLAINELEKKHSAEILFIVEQSMPLSWTFFDFSKRARFILNRILKKKVVNKHFELKYVMVYLEIVDQKFEIIASKNINITQESLDFISESSVKKIKSEGLNKGCLFIVEKLSSEIMNHDLKNNIAIKSENTLPDDVIEIKD